MGVVREGDGLEGALDVLAGLAEEAESLSVGGRSRYNPEWVEVSNLRNMVQVCEAAVRSALLRRESRGAHQRLDHPDLDDEWRANVHCRAEDGRLEVWRGAAHEVPEGLRGETDG